MSFDDVIWQKVVVKDHVLSLCRVIAPIYPTLIPLQGYLKLLELYLDQGNSYSCLLIDNPLLKLINLAWVTKH